MLNFELGKPAEEILRLLVKHERLTVSEITLLLNKDIFEIGSLLKPSLDRAYIRNVDKGPHTVIHMDGIYYVTAEGKNYLEVQDKLYNRFQQDLLLRLLPIIISCLALIKSFWPELMYAWKLLTQ